MLIGMLLRWFDRGLPSAHRSRFRIRLGLRVQVDMLVAQQVESLEARDLLSAVTAFEPRGIGGGGAMFVPAISPFNSDEIYVASDMSQILHTSSRGSSWDIVDFRQIQGGPEARVSFTSDPNILYGLDSGSRDARDILAPVKSVDGGKTWTHLVGDPTDFSVVTVLGDGTDPNRVLVTNYGTLFMSLDGGDTFAAKYVGLDSGSGIHIAGAFFDGADIYIGTNEGLLVSNDGGQNFSLASIRGLPSGQGFVSFTGAKQDGVTRLIGVTRDQGTIYGGILGSEYYGYRSIYSLDIAAAENSANSSANVGTWQQRATGVAAGAYPFFIDMAQNNINVAYVGGGSDTGRPTIFKTTDGGLSWLSVFNTTNNGNIQTGWAGDGGDKGSTYGETALGLDVSATNANEVIITDFGFSHLSDDGGATWKNLNVAAGQLNAAGSPIVSGGAYHSSGLDNDSAWGVTWADPTHLFASYTDISGLLSDDGGRSWSRGYQGLTLNSTYRAITQPNGVMYAATASVHDLYQSTTLRDDIINPATGKVVFSADKGVTWQTLHDFGHAVSWVASDPNKPNRLYACVAHSTAGGIYVTDNLQLGAKSTWRKLGTPPRTQGHANVLQVLKDGTLVVSYSGRLDGNSDFTASSGVFVSTNGGATWQDRSSSGMKFWTKDVVIDPTDSAQNTWYAGVFNGWSAGSTGQGGLYKTMDRGKTWTRILTLDRVESATVSPTNTNEMYVTTETEGLWYTDNLRSASPTFTQVDAYKFRHPERVIYNPYNPAEIWVTSFGGSLQVGYAGSSAGLLQFEQSMIAVNENAGTATITVDRVGGSNGSVSVNYTTSSGTSISAVDFSGNSGTLTFADGEVTKSFTVPILNDSIVEPNETFQISLNAPLSNALPDNSVLGTQSIATVTIRDDEVAAPGKFQVRDAVASIHEESGFIDITVDRVLGQKGVIKVQYATSGITANSNVDFTSGFGTLVFAENETSKTIRINILNDHRIDPNERFSLRLVNASNGGVLGVLKTAVITIIDDEINAPGTIQFSQAAADVREDAGFIDITVTRTSGSQKGISVKYAVTGGTAISGKDFKPVSGTLTFGEGEFSKTIRVSVLNNLVVDGTRTLQVTLGSPTVGASLGLSQMLLSILDDETP